MLSLPHLVVLFVVALVIFGPQKLPELARMLGKATAEFRKMTGDFRYALEQEVNEMERQTRIKEAETAAATATAAAKTEAPAEPPAGTTPREPPALGIPEPGIAEPGVPESGAWEITVPATSQPTDQSIAAESAAAASVSPEPMLSTTDVPALPPHIGSPADAASAATTTHEKLEKLTDDNAAA